MPACFMIAFAVYRDSQWVDTVTHWRPQHQRWCEPFCL